MRKKQKKRRPPPSLIGQLIRHWRLRRGISVTELADAVDVDSQLVSMWESGAVSQPRQDTLLRVIAVLDLTVPGFYGAEREMRAAD